MEQTNPTKNPVKPTYIEEKLSPDKSRWVSCLVALRHWERTLPYKAFFSVEEKSSSLCRTLQGIPIIANLCEVYSLWLHISSMKLPDPIVGTSTQRTFKACKVV
jgi:hypothetical protein